ncbi:hypothetical protein DAI22_05g018900 [Oryza sativa Japonica Group]|nr:hypothetical protein DAI22_05g018900 [Oryza sativa Japonica Group]
MTYRLLEPILEKDSRCCFLRLFVKRMHRLISGFIITPETLNCVIIKNAMRCAKVILEGQAPEFGGFRANPNCMNQYGYFPLHEAAESFSVDMIKLLICHGALANLRTSGKNVKEGLLPLHVAVENTCLHKYLEENLFPNQEHPDYSQEDIYKAIHLMCLPEMKIFLDTTRELAKHTNNLVDEVWNYMKDGKLIHSAVLLLAAQDHIRSGSSCRKVGGNKLDGFATIFARIHHSMALEWQMHQNGQAKLKLLLSSSLLVNIIFRAGEALDAYIREHSMLSSLGASAVPHTEVLEHVSLILKGFDFCPTGEGIDVGNISVASKATTDVPYLLAVKKKAMRKKKPPHGWEDRCKLLSYLPFWRTVLSVPWCPAKNLPSHRLEDQDKHLCQINNHRRKLREERRKLREEASSATPNHNLGLFGRIPHLSIYQPRRLFASAALTLIKVLRNA